MKTGAERRPHRESKLSTQHPHRTHRTHDTSDQWREIFGGWGESRRFWFPSEGFTESVSSGGQDMECLLVHFSKEN